MKSIGLNVPTPGRPLWMANPPTPGDALKFGMSMRFSVSVHGATTTFMRDLGLWTTCEGLQVTFSTVPIESGGVYGWELCLPEQVGYQNVTLSRGMTAKSSGQVQTWLASVSRSWQSGEPENMSVVITLLDTYREPVTRWELQNAWPVRWTGPTFDAGNSAIAIETLEFTHEGWLDQHAE